VLENRPALGNAEQAHRGARRPAALGRAAGIEDLKAILPLVEGEVAVAEDDGVGIGEARPHPRQPAFGRAGVVEDGDRDAADPDLDRLRQPFAELLLVDVSVHRVDPGAESFEVFENGDREEVAGVDQPLRAGDQLQAAIREASGAPWHVGVGEDGDHDQAGF